MQNWIGVRVGVPIYVQPVAYSLLLGAPIKFTFGDKLALGGLDDLLNIKLKRFAPSFAREDQNAIAAYLDMTNTVQSAGHLRISGYAIYQYQPNLALIGRLGVDQNLGGDSGSMAGTSNVGTTQTFIRAGLDFTPRKWIDVGGSLGFDDLGHIGTFGPAGYLAVRI